MNNSKLLEVTGLSASYGTCAALRRLDLVVSESEIVGLCGPNKAGKSTLCGCVAGIVRSTGSIRLKGEEISAEPAHTRLARGIALCPEGRGIYPGMSVLENLWVGGDGLPKAVQRQRIDEVLHFFPILASRFTQLAGTLSGGEAQMLGIARRLVRRPSVLIVDEPSLGLAPMAVHRVFEALSELRKHSSTTILVVEEGLARLAGRVDRCYVMRMGRMVASGSVDELAESPIVAETFAGEAPPRLDTWGRGAGRTMA